MVDGPGAVRDAMAGWLAAMWPAGDGWDFLVTVTLDRRRNAGGRGATLPPQRMTLGAGVDGDRRPARTARTRDSDGVMPVASFARRLHSALRVVEADLGRPVTVMGGIEPHLDGWPHAHLLFKLGGVLDPAWAAILIRRTFHQRFGWTRVEVPRVQGDVAGYCSKYVVKSSPEAWVIYPDTGPVVVQRGIGASDADNVNPSADIRADAGRLKRTRRGACETAGAVEVADRGRRVGRSGADVSGAPRGDTAGPTGDGRVGTARDAVGGFGRGWGRTGRSLALRRALRARGIG